MAEGMLGGMLGGEEGERASLTEAGPEAFAAALAANITGQSPEVAAKTAAFFDKQIDVLEIQRKVLETEHEYFEAEWGPRLLGIRLRVAFQLLAVLIAALIGIGAVVLLRDTVTSRRVVIEPFDAPPALVARGLTGKVIAGALLDELGRAQDAT